MTFIYNKGHSGDYVHPVSLEILWLHVMPSQSVGQHLRQLVLLYYGLARKPNPCSVTSIKTWYVYINVKLYHTPCYRNFGGFYIAQSW